MTKLSCTPFPLRWILWNEPLNDFNQQLRECIVNLWWIHSEQPQNRSIKTIENVYGLAKWADILWKMLAAEQTASILLVNVDMIHWRQTGWRASLEHFLSKDNRSRSLMVLEVNCRGQASIRLNPLKLASSWWKCVCVCMWFCMCMWVHVWVCVENVLLAALMDCWSWVMNGAESPLGND